MMRPVGSPGYVAPEMVAAQPQPCDEKVDLFALGILLYFMAYRTLPFYASSVEEMLQKTRRCEVGLLFGRKGVG